MIWFAAVFHILLIVAAYRVGRNNAGYGVALFAAGVIGFQLFALGPSSFISGGCSDYGVRASDC